ncbi:MAG: plasmid mobilization relaxosome protein MobC [Acutalibacteraceae bacterium]|nr:plasmid mobilization relaxosome protein MobC [Acutalibacteraceae bacterium]
MGTKSEFIKIRVTPEEKEKIANNAQMVNMSVSQYLLTLVTRKRMIVLSEVTQLVADIHGAAVNLNQIARVANSQKFVNKNNVDEIKRLSEELKKLLNEIIKLIIEQDEDSNVAQPRVTNQRLDNVENALGEILQSIKEIQGKLE